MGRNDGERQPIEGKTPTKADLRRGTVVKVDEVADLALVRVDAIPLGIEPLLLGDMAQLSVGDDVHAIGHPTGEAWTYTKGVISQIRQDYQWSSQETKKAHRADIIQTQTPINPGNSGGPLLSDQGTLIGVNSFKSQGEGLNFAVAVDEVQRFIAAPSGRVAADVPVRHASATSSSCQPKELYSGRNKEGNGYILSYDLDCDGKADMEIRIPDDTKEPITAVFDRKKTGKIDLIVFDADRDQKWDVSLHETKSQGHWDLIGLHPDGGLVASRFIPYSKEAFARVLGDPATYKH
jgi:Trypsin-like peptidase domain